MCIFQKEYDDYVASLLDTQGSKHKVLYEQVESMSQRQGANPRILAREKVNVQRMEEETKDLLEDNERWVFSWGFMLIMSAFIFI